MGPYFIDLYLPKLNLAIECDEYGHKAGYDKRDEVVRQKFIETALGCDFRRFDPYDPIFNIGSLINEILVRREKLWKANETSQE